MSERRALLGLVGGAVALGLVWWSPSMPGGTNAPVPQHPRFGVADVNPELVDALPDGERAASVRGHLTASGDIVGTLWTDSGRYFTVHVSGDDGRADVAEATVTLTGAVRPVSGSGRSPRRGAGHRSSVR